MKEKNLRRLVSLGLNAGTNNEGGWAVAVTQSMNWLRKIDHITIHFLYLTFHIKNPKCIKKLPLPLQILRTLNSFQSSVLFSKEYPTTNTYSNYCFIVT